MGASDHPELVDLRPGPDREPAAVAETHISVVVFAGDRAFKLLKPVELGFIHLATREQRKRAIHDELEINRRFAPDVYLGTLDLVDELGEPVDHMLVMRRLPHDRRYSLILSGPDAVEETRRVARAVAAIHAEAPRTPEAAQAAGWDIVARNWADNFVAMRPFVGEVFDATDVDRIEAAVTAYLEGRRPLFEARISSGHAVDGHGDLLAQDIFCLEDGPRILDCLAFDTTLRCGDVLADVAFLAMDVERLVGPELAAQLLRWYREFSNEHHPGSLAHFYVGYRAHVRAKVGALSLAQGDVAAAQRAATLHDLALRHVTRAIPRLVLVGGAPGTGKTTLADEVADACGWAVLGSDELRKDLAGVPHDVHRDDGLDQGLYTPAMTEATYDELVTRAGRLLSLGESVVLDASWIDERHRRRARTAAREHRAAIVELRCEVPIEESRRRVDHRRTHGTDASDATVDVTDELHRRMARWPEATTIGTDGSIADSLAASIDHLATLDPLEHL